MLFVFDCDGVLVDSEPIAAAVDAELLAEIGYAIAPADIARRFAGLSGKAIGEAIAAELGRPLPEDFLDRTKAEIDRRLATELKPVAGIHELLDTLDAPRCVCSNSASARLKISLTTTRLYERFQPHVYSAVEVGTREPKPSPNVYSYAIGAFGVAAREALVIEDTVPGIAAARAAGARVVGFTGGSHTWPGHADILMDAGAETVISRLADLPKVAEAMATWAGIGE